MSSNHPNSAESEDGYDATVAFKQRRQIYLTVQELQRLEHEAVNRIAEQTTVKKKELLKILSDWLLAQRTTAQEHLEVEQLSGCQMSEWLSLQNQAVTLQNEQYRCQCEADVASEKYKAVAPMAHMGMGFVSEWFAEESKKLQIQQLGVESKLKSDANNHAVSRVADNLGRRQQFGKRFLRGCLANVQELEHSNIFGRRCRTIVGELTNSVRAEWLSHLQATKAAMNSLDANLEELRRIYRLNGR